MKGDYDKRTAFKEKYEKLRIYSRKALFSVIR